VSISQAKVTIITVTYNSADFIEEYLASVAPFLTNTGHNLVIVDNASTDDTCSKVLEYAESNQLSSNIHLDASKENLGFGKGCNQAVEIAKESQPTHLWFLNPDTRVFIDSGKELLSLLELNDVDFAGSILVDENMNPRPGAFRFPGIVSTFLSTMSIGVLDKIFHKHTKTPPLQDTPYQADWLTGASFMTRLDCFDTLKGFDPFYFLYFEEVDLFYRAKKSGLSVWACPKSKVFHLSGASTGINNHKEFCDTR